MNLSEEQKTIINNIVNGKNVIVDAVAGSGKTTTILEIARTISDKFENKNILKITYNTALKIEVRKKAFIYGLTERLKVHTYHSLGYTYYNKNCNTDKGLIQALEYNIAPSDEILPFDIIIVDESQDMSHLYYLFLAKFYRDLKLQFNKNIQLAFLGDNKQCIYQFKNAYAYYLTHANDLWFYPINNLYIRNYSNGNLIDFEKCDLTISYRVTNQIAEFINKIMLGYNRIKAVKNGTNVKYIISQNTNGTYNTSFYLAAYINMKIRNGSHKAGDFLIIMPSVKTRGKNDTPWIKLENALASNNHLIHVPNSDSENIKGEDVSNKILITTIHQSKGLERKVVIVYNFDESYFHFYNKNGNNNVCPNTYYVAVTRASEELILLVNDENDSKHLYNRPFKFLNFGNYRDHKEILDKFVTFYTVNKSSKPTKTNIATIHICDKDLNGNKNYYELCEFSNYNYVKHVNVPVTDNLTYKDFVITDIVRFLDSTAISELEKDVNKILIKKDIHNTLPINCKNSINFNWGNENVSIINSLTCTNNYFIINNHKDQIINIVNEFLFNVYPNDEEVYTDFRHDLEILIVEYEKANANKIPEDLSLLSLYKIFKEKNYKSLSPSQLLKVSSLYECLNSKIFSRYRQMGNKYNWLTKEILQQSYDNLCPLLDHDIPPGFQEDLINNLSKIDLEAGKQKILKHVKNVCKTEKKTYPNMDKIDYQIEKLLLDNFAFNIKDEKDNTTSVFLSGRTDYIFLGNDAKLIEFKFKEKTELTDILQLIFYIYLYYNRYSVYRNKHYDQYKIKSVPLCLGYRLNDEINEKNIPNKFILYNIKTTDYYEIKPINSEDDYNYIKSIVEKTLKYKLKVDNNFSYEDFITNLELEEKNYVKTFVYTKNIDERIIIRANELGINIDELSVDEIVNRINELTISDNSSTKSEVVVEINDNDDCIDYFA